MKIGRIKAASSPCWSLRACSRDSRAGSACAALPGRAEDLRERGLQSGVGVADGQLDADQAARDQAAQNVAPERLGLSLADVEADDLAASGLLDTMRDDHALVDDAPAGAALLDLGVDEQVGAPPSARPLSERLDLLVE